MHLKIKKGDTVKILSGKDKGKTAKVIKVFPKSGKVTMDSINLHTKYEKSKQANQSGKKIVFPTPLPISKVMLVDSSSGRPTRVGYKILENGNKLRIAKASGKAI